MMKKILVLIALIAVCLPMTGCDDDDNRNDIILETISLNITRGDSRLIWVSGGDGDYSIRVDNPAIVAAQIQQTNLGPAVSVKARQEGHTVITVSDAAGHSAICSLSVQSGEMSIRQTTLRATTLNMAYPVPIIGGSGKFSATIDNPEIAGVSIDTDNWELLVTAKKEGEAEITITDTEGNKSAGISLTVKESGLEITGTRYAVDAGTKEAIEAELRDNPPYAVGATLYFSDGEYTIKHPDGTIIDSGTFSLEPGSITTSYGIPIDDQIYSMVKFSMTSGEKTIDYNMFIVRGGFYYFCEDLTGYYKTKFPDASVKQVGRGLIFRNN